MLVTLNGQICISQMVKEYKKYFQNTVILYLELNKITKFRYDVAEIDFRNSVSLPVKYNMATDKYFTNI